MATRHKTEKSKKKGSGLKPFRPEYVGVARKLCASGFSEFELADFFGVDLLTYCRWEAEKEGFFDAVMEGRALADARVERSLFRRAVGYSCDAVKIFPPRRDGAAPLIVPYQEHLPPDTKAAIFLIQHRRQNERRDKVNPEPYDRSASQRQGQGLSLETLEGFEQIVANFPEQNLKIPAHWYPAGHPLGGAIKNDA
jgi:hypothetical protein